MKSDSMLSHAGIRPMSAFVVIGTVVLVVAGWVAWLIEDRAGRQPVRARERVGTVPSYAIRDARDRTLARFVPRFDLELSPRAMWQAHTPTYMCERISEVLGGSPTPEELEAAFLPDARDGIIVVDAWDLSARQANELGTWLAGGEEAEEAPIEGMWLEPVSGQRHAWRLAWQPARVLSREQREARGHGSAWTWGRALANGIAACLRDPSEPEPRGSGPRDAMRAEIWSALIPRAWCRPLKGLPSEAVLALRELLDEEGVAAWQMQLSFGRDRVYPSGEHELYGSWGYLEPTATEPAPREGLELLCDRLLQQPDWQATLDLTPPVYRWLTDRTVRGNREDGYLDYRPPAATPTVQATLDLELQAFVRGALEDLIDEHKAALAMAIVVDVENGDVLAVDSVEHYEIAPFAPIYHEFTTGSTLKVLTMAAALEEGLVQPDETFDVGHGEYRVVHEGRPTGRVIHEAEGAAQGIITARESIAFSVNAGLTQIGLRVPDHVFRGYLAALGYGRAPGSGLGIEHGGHLAKLPWSYAYTHASICFGHEISSTVWQHAAGLATLARGGVYRPLRIVRAVEQGDLRWELDPEEGQRVFSERTSELVRDMMRHGATVGTGRDVRKSLLGTAAAYLGLPEEEGLDAAAEFLDLASKTGTAQKVGTERCVHVELAARERWRERGLPATPQRLRALRDEPKPHRNCYTSSIVLFGKRQDQDRQLMVYVVAEEPSGKQRFGSRVSGPTAGRILAEALGLTQGGEPPRQEVASGFFASDVADRNELDEPWRQEVQRW